MNKELTNKILETGDELSDNKLYNEYLRKVMRVVFPEEDTILSALLKATGENPNPQFLNKTRIKLLEGYNNFATFYHNKRPIEFKALWENYRLTQSRIEVLSWFQFCEDGRIKDIGPEEDDEIRLQEIIAHCLSWDETHKIDKAISEHFSQTYKPTHPPNGKPKYKLLEEKVHPQLGITTRVFKNTYNNETINTIWNIKEEKPQTRIEYLERLPKDNLLKS